MVAFEIIVTSVLAMSVSVIALISVLFWNIRRSRCSHIKCWGCSCDREIMTTEELAADLNPVISVI